jgi:molecular chaperone Hsp33
MSKKDSVLRAVTHDGSFRVMAAETTTTVREALERQLPPDLTEDGEGPNSRRLPRGERPADRAFAEVLTAAVLLRESMAPDLRVQVVLQADDRKSRMVADTHPSGMTRGLVQLAPNASGFAFQQQGVLQVQRTLHNGALHQGVVGVPEGGNISSTFMRYFQESEQIVTMMSVGCTFAGETLVAAGGYVVQLMPEVERLKLAVMAERLEDFKDIGPMLEKGTASPRELLYETLYGMPYDQVAERDVFFGCNCSETRLLAGLASLPKSEIAELAQSEGVLEIGCDFCRKEYRFAPEQLRGLLAAN